MPSNVLKKVNRTIDLYFLVQLNDFKAIVEVNATGKSNYSKIFRRMYIAHLIK